jgi:hypothetical protein
MDHSVHSLLHCFCAPLWPYAWKEMWRGLSPTPGMGRCQVCDQTEGTAHCMAVLVGDTVPAITLPRSGGGELAFDQLRGTRALLFFWGSW